MIPDYKEIPGFEGLYEISEFGQIRSIPRVVAHGHSKKMTINGGIRKYRLDKDGYPTLKLSKNGVKYHYAGHRLVALTWIPNPLNLPEVNHKDGIKTNIHKGNLEWVTKAGNAKHAYGHFLRVSPWLGKGSMTGKFGSAHNQAKAVIQLTMDGEFVREYAFIREAKKDGFQPTHIGACAKGKIPHHRHFKWIYKQPSPKNI